MWRRLVLKAKLLGHFLRREGRKELVRACELELGRLSGLRIGRSPLLLAEYTMGEVARGST